MSHFGDYMDDVPVKISEKYKRPPRVELPYSVTECPARAKRLIESIRSCTTYERNVLSKVKELRSAKEIKKSERRHRLQLLEEAKQKKLDAIATAEAEEKLKQLSVSEVSYPSTDEISAISPDEKVDKNCDKSLTQENSPEADCSTAAEAGYSSTTTESQQNILQPIQVQSNLQQNNLLDDPDPLQELKLNSKIAKVAQFNQNVETLTYKDFENDTSSPFDNVELKTINDMELLAQVLQSQRDSTTSCQAQQAYPDQTYPMYANCATQAQIEAVTYLPNTYLEQPIQAPGIIYAAPPHYHMPNGYYIPEAVCENPMPIENVYLPNYHYLVPAQPYAMTDAYYNQLPTSSAEVSQVPNGSSYIPQPYYFHCPHVPIQYMGQPYNPVTESKNVEDQNQNPPAHNQNQNPAANSQSSVKSRSRSVPDIVQELNDELAAARLRATEWTVTPGSANSRFLTDVDRKLEGRYWKKVERLLNPYETLPEKMQRMCRNIHSMGFPIDRVARICSLVGDNDKKVIENLLLLGEFLDLGFLESKAEEALAKHEFNKDKALDELLS